jgi:Arc/MetJ family transcription regulator
MAYTSGGTMRTNIVLDDQLLEEALSLSEHRTKKDLIHEALRVFIRLKKRKDLSELAGKISLSDDFNHKRLRKLRG